MAKDPKEDDTLNESAGRVPLSPSAPEEPKPKIKLDTRIGDDEVQKNIKKITKMSATNLGEDSGELEIGPGLPDTIKPDLVIEPSVEQLVKQNVRRPQPLFAVGLNKLEPLP